MLWLDIIYGILIFVLLLLVIFSYIAINKMNKRVNSKLDDFTNTINTISQTGLTNDQLNKISDHAVLSIPSIDEVQTLKTNILTLTDLMIKDKNVYDELTKLDDKNKTVDAKTVNINDKMCIKDTCIDQSHIQMLTGNKEFAIKSQTTNNYLGDDKELKVTACIYGPPSCVKNYNAIGTSTNQKKWTMEI